VPEGEAVVKAIDPASVQAGEGGPTAQAIERKVVTSNAIGCDVPAASKATCVHGAGTDVAAHHVTTAEPVTTKVPDTDVASATHAAATTEPRIRRHGGAGTDNHRRSQHKRQFAYHDASLIRPGIVARREVPFRGPVTGQLFLVAPSDPST